MPVDVERIFPGEKLFQCLHRDRIDAWSDSDQPLIGRNLSDRSATGSAATSSANVVLVRPPVFFDAETLDLDVDDPQPAGRLLRARKRWLVVQQRDCSSGGDGLQKTPAGPPGARWIEQKLADTVHARSLPCRLTGAAVDIATTRAVAGLVKSVIDCTRKCANLTDSGPIFTDRRLQFCNGLRIQG